MNELKKKPSLAQYLSTEKCFKLILGANNENYGEITNLVALYSSAGCKFFDLNASKDAVYAAKKGLEFFGVKDAYLCISVGTKNDPHLSKCRIASEKCISCGACKDVCIQNAISVNEKCSNIDENKCIGCAKCLKTCRANAIERYSTKKDWMDFLPELFDLVDCIEFHIISEDKAEIDTSWDYLRKNYGGMLSICADRSLYSNVGLKNQLSKMVEKCGKHRCMVQADGSPMSGGSSDYRTTLQAVACADIVLKANLGVPVIMSGGTNSKTMELARQCDLDVNGVAIGSFARKIVKEYIEDENFLSDKNKFNEALKIAQELVNTVNAENRS